MVWPVCAVAGDTVCRRRHTARVNLLELAGIGQDVAKLLGKQLNLGSIELEVGELGDRLDLRSRQRCGHGKC